MIDLKSPLQRGILGWVMFAIVMVLLPHIVNTGTTRTFVFAMYLAIFAISWDVMSGRTGYISFGHPFLIGIGGYTSALLTYHLHWPLYFSICVVFLSGTSNSRHLFCVGHLGIYGTHLRIGSGDRTPGYRGHAGFVRTGKPGNRCHTKLLPGTGGFVNPGF